MKELALLTVGVAAGIALLLLMGLGVNYGGVNFISWGYPLAWHYQIAIPSAPSPLFGVFFGRINWFALIEDMIFWLALSLAVVEGTSYFALPYLRRKLEIRRTRQTSGPAQTMN